MADTKLSTYITGSKDHVCFAYFASTNTSKSNGLRLKLNKGFVVFFNSTYHVQWNANKYNIHSFKQCITNNWKKDHTTVEFNRRNEERRQGNVMRMQRSSADKVFLWDFYKFFTWKWLHFTIRLMYGNTVHSSGTTWFWKIIYQCFRSLMRQYEFVNANLRYICVCVSFEHE